MEGIFTLLGTEFDLTPAVVVRAMKSARRQYAAQLNSRGAEEELLVMNSILIPSTEKDGFQSIDYSALLGERVDSMRPELSDKLYNRVSDVDNSPMRTVIDSQLECSRLLLFGDSAVF